jgi:hypothetical protein
MTVRIPSTIAHSCETVSDGACRRTGYLSDRRFIRTVRPTVRGSPGRPT